MCITRNTTSTKLETSCVRYIRYFLSVALLALQLVPGQILATEFSVSRKQEIIHLLRHDCGSCHGMTLKGGLGPALTRVRMETRSAEALFSIIKFGIEGSPMPPWQGLLSDEEISWLADQLKKGSLAGQ